MREKFHLEEASQSLVRVPYYDATAAHTAKIRDNPADRGFVVFIDPPVPGVGTCRKTFRSAKKAVLYAVELIRKPCLICQVGGSHSERS